MHAVEDGTSSDKKTPGGTVDLLEELVPSGDLLPSVSRSKRWRLSSRRPSGAIPRSREWHSLLAAFSWIAGVGEPEHRRGLVSRRRGLVRASGADPVVGEEDVLARVDARHMAGDAIAAGLDGARSAGGGRLAGGPGVRVGRLRRGTGTGAARGVTRQADRQIRRAVGRGPRVGIVAGDATERAAALAKAAGLEDPDRLEPGQEGIVGPDLAGMRPGRMAMAGAA
jgi:hypothetical protein